MQLPSICCQSCVRNVCSLCSFLEALLRWCRKVPLLNAVVPRQRQFRGDLAVINQCLDELIALAKSTRNAADAEALQARDYTQVCHLP